MSDEDEEKVDSRYKYASGYRGVEAAPGMEEASGTRATGGRLLEDSETVELTSGVGAGQSLNLADTCKLGFCTRRTVSGSEYCEQHQAPFPQNTFDPDNRTTGFERRRTDPDTQQRLTRIEAKLDALLSVLDVDLEEVDDDA